MSLWVAGAGYAVCVDFLYDRPIRRWTDERKAATADGIWRVVLTELRRCLLMNSSGGNWRRDRTIIEGSLTGEFC
jgi:hypothetical protein